MLFTFIIIFFTTPYFSGGYGSYGGIDLILIKLKKPANAVNVSAICLPTMEYQDSNVKAIIAGYGKYRRAPCQVGAHGPTKVILAIVFILTPILFTVGLQNHSFFYTQD